MSYILERGWGGICIHKFICSAQRLHRIEIWISRSADGKTGKAFVGDLTEEKSIEMASKLASEGFVFGVSYPACQ